LVPTHYSDSKMFFVQLDRCRRSSLKKLRSKKFSAKSTLFALAFFLCFMFILGLLWRGNLWGNRRNDHSIDVDEEKEFARKWQKAVEEIEFAKNNPTESASRTVATEENPLFVRTAAVQSLYEYLRAFSARSHAAEHAASPDFHHVECVTTFSGLTNDRLPQYTEAVRDFLNQQHRTIYHQDTMASFAMKMRVEESIQKGLPVWADQEGVVAVRDIAENICIGQYYGDEYLSEEFEAVFPWDELRGETGHPFRRKHDYLMRQNYNFLDFKLALPPNTSVAIDGFHDYDYAEFRSGQHSQLLPLEQSQKKVTLEGLINDPRANLSISGLSAEDLNRKNTEFVYCAVDGVLLSFVVTHKEIKAGEQLFISYGPGYIV